MNWQHFSTVLWLRWRVSMNQLQRGGISNKILLIILTILAIIAATAMAVGGFLVGAIPLKNAPPVVLLLVWDGVVLTFLFLWLIGLMTELQRPEVFNPSKFLHLPVSLTGVFLINYLSSLVRLSTILFVPGMVGLSLGLVVSRGLTMLWLFPLLFGFFLMVTAVTYQFQGWLGALMANPRRRRTIIVVTTIAFVLVAQLPNYLFHGPLRASHRAKAFENNAELTELRTRSFKILSEISQREQKLQAPGAAGDDESVRHEIDELKRQLEQIDHELEEIPARRRKRELERIGRWATIGSAVIPPGWLPLGAMGAASAKFVLATGALLGMLAIGTASLWRGYRTTLRFYTGQLTASPTKPQRAQPTDKWTPGRSTFLERHLPGVSECASAVALAGFQSLLRAPEAKMMLLTPLIMLIVGASMIFPRMQNPSPFIRTMVPFSAIAFVLFSLFHFVGNQFGHDRGGFRVFILAPVPRREILLGKNLALAPLAILLSWTMLAMVQVFAPVGWGHFVALIVQSVTMYIILCMMANFLSIYAPMPVAAGSMRVIKPTIMTVLLQTLFALAYPIAVSVVLVPLAVELFWPDRGWLSHVPINLLMSLVELTVVLLVYLWLLTAQGELLESREKKILEVVTRTE